MGEDPAQPRGGRPRGRVSAARVRVLPDRWHRAARGRGERRPAAGARCRRSIVGAADRRGVAALHGARGGDRRSAAPHPRRRRRRERAVPRAAPARSPVAHARTAAGDLRARHQAARGAGASAGSLRRRPTRPGRRGGLADRQRRGRREGRRPQAARRDRRGARVPRGGRERADARAGALGAPRPAARTAGAWGKGASADRPFRAPRRRRLVAAARSPCASRPSEPERLAHRAAAEARRPDRARARAAARAGRAGRLGRNAGGARPPARSRLASGCAPGSARRGPASGSTPSARSWRWRRGPGSRKPGRSSFRATTERAPAGARRDAGRRRAARRR